MLLEERRGFDKITRALRLGQTVRFRLAARDFLEAVSEAAD
jgi:hypothetical protein